MDPVSVEVDSSSWWLGQLTVTSSSQQEHASPTGSCYQLIALAVVGRLLLFCRRVSLCPVLS